MNRSRTFFARTLLGSIVVGITVVGSLALVGNHFQKEKNVPPISTTTISEPIKLSYTADFYDNYGSLWFSIEGQKFKLSPNKVKEYAYSSSGAWVSSYTTSSVISIEIDGKQIESCGSTVLLADTCLEKYPIDIPTEVKSTTNTTEASISSPNDLRFKDYWNLRWWWQVKDAYNYDGRAKVVLVQSQQGDPICMYSGDKVTWELSRNLPQTTEIIIDGMKLYIHRANFTILDSTVFN